MTTAVQLPPKKAKPSPVENDAWEQLRHRVAEAGELPNVAKTLGSKPRSEADVEELMRRFEAGEFRNQE